MRTLLTLAVVAAVLSPGQARSELAVSREAERFLAGVSYERPPSAAEKRDLMRALGRHGILTLTDLRPFLTRPERVRHNALIAMDAFPHIDDRTLGLVEDLAREVCHTPEPSAATAVRMVLHRRPRPAASAFALAIAPRSDFGALREVMTWLGEDPQLGFATSADAHPLIRATLARLTGLFEQGTYSGEWPISFSLLMAQPPFDDPAHTEPTIRAFMSALRNMGRVTDLREIALAGSFAVVMSRARQAPRLVEADLLHITTTGSPALTRLLLWRMSIDGFDRTPSGRLVLSVTLRRLPALLEFVARLNAARRDDPDARRVVKQDVEHALDALPLPDDLSGVRTARAR